jgi:hypothetical protein
MKVYDGVSNIHLLPETGTVSVYWAQLCRFDLKTEAESSLCLRYILNKRQDDD